MDDSVPDPSTTPATPGASRPPDAALAPLSAAAHETWERFRARHPSWEPARILLVATALVAVGGMCWVYLVLGREPTTALQNTMPSIHAPTSMGTPTTGAPESNSTTTSAPSSVVVDVAGAVRHPGVVRVEGGGRVTQAIALAGGPRPDADLARVNRARIVHDGDFIYVPRRGENAVPQLLDGAVNGPASAPDADGSAPASTGPVNLNTASAKELEALPGVGPATAQAIIDHRQSVGRFTRVEDLLDVRGIGDAKFAQLKALVVV